MQSILTGRNMATCAVIETSGAPSHIQMRRTITQATAKEVGKILSLCGIHCYTIMGTPVFEGYN